MFTRMYVHLQARADLQGGQGGPWTTLGFCFGPSVHDHIEGKAQDFFRWTRGRGSRSAVPFSNSRPWRRGLPSPRLAPRSGGPVSQRPARPPVASPPVRLASSQFPTGQAATGAPSRQQRTPNPSGSRPAGARRRAAQSGRRRRRPTTAQGWRRRVVQQQRTRTATGSASPTAPSLQIQLVSSSSSEN
jgi:hypothetical protein